MRGGGVGMGMRAERTPRGRGARAGQTDLPKRKPSLKKLWPQIKTLVMPRRGLLVAGLCLMAINRLAGLVLPYMSKPLLDNVLSANGNAALLPKYIAIVFGAMIAQAITSYSLTQVSLQHMAYPIITRGTYSSRIHIATRTCGYGLKLVDPEVDCGLPPCA